MVSTTTAAEQAGGKGLKANALGLLSTVVIGVSSTAPGYGLAATLGFVVALVGIQTPIIMILAFVPMFLIAYAYRELNRVSPDCGTTFTWATQAFGPKTGWMGGWGIIAADVIVMASLAQIAGSYFFLMFGRDDLAGSRLWVTVAGCIWIAVLTWVCYRGIEISARLQFVLLAVEIVILVIFSVVALFRVYTNHALSTSVKPQWSWFNPAQITSFDGSTSAAAAFSGALLLAVFIYWGWDTAVAVNEETREPEKTPGRAAVMSTLILLATFAIVSVATMAFAGVGTADKPTSLVNSDDVFSSIGSQVLGGGFDKFLIFAILSSAAASTQTTILPTSRAVLSMAAYEALPAKFARTHPRFLTPTWATVAMGGVSIVFYVGLAAISNNILADAASAVGLLIAFYYGLTGFAAAWYFKNDRGDTIKDFAVRVVMPFLGGAILLWAFIETLVANFDPASSDTQISIFGFTVGGIFVISVGSLLLGILLMLVTQFRSPRFFTGEVLNRSTVIRVLEGDERRMLTPAMPDSPSMEQTVIPPMTEKELQEDEARGRDER
ncbi:MAG TPA: amino acid transporter [Actinobacteria bacterium]|nr:amino acid transporter [Actinomycetota bacterium]